MYGRTRPQLHHVFPPQFQLICSVAPRSLLPPCPATDRRLSLKVHGAIAVCSIIIVKQSMRHSMSSMLPAHHKLEVVAAGLHTQVLAHELGVLALSSLCSI